MLCGNDGAVVVGQRTKSAFDDVTWSMTQQVGGFYLSGLIVRAMNNNADSREGKLRRSSCLEDGF